MTNNIDILDEIYKDKDKLDGARHLAKSIEIFTITNPIFAFLGTFYLLRMMDKDLIREGYVFIGAEAIGLGFCMLGGLVTIILIVFVTLGIHKKPNPRWIPIGMFLSSVFIIFLMIAVISNYMD